MVYYPVADRGLVNMPWFWVVNFKGVVWSVFIRFIRQVLLQGKQFVVEVQSKFYDIFSTPFAGQKFPPGGK